MEKYGYMIKLRRGDLEFKVSGDKQFVIDQFEKYINMFHKNSIKKNDDTSKKIVVDSINASISKNIEDIKIPLDVYMKKYDTSSLQQKFLVTALYLKEIQKLSSFRSRDINNILKENNFKPFHATATHIHRLRNKGLISIIRKKGNESILTIHKDSIEDAKEFIKKAEG